MEIAAGDSVAVQYLGSSTWGVIVSAGGDGDGGGGAAPAERVLLAFSDQAIGTNTDGQTGASGVASQALPADYTDFDNTELLVYDPRNNTTTFIRVRNDWLAVQTDGNAPKLGAFDQDEAGSRQWITWTPSTRTFGRGGQSATANNILRIVGVRLYDDGGAGGSGGEIADNSIAPAKAEADTDAEKRAWRDRLATAKVSIGTTLPAIADTGETEIVIMAQDVADGLSFVDIVDRATELTGADVGDVIMTIMFREKQWVRVGNVITGRGDATARAAIEALMLRVAANEQLTSDIDRIVDGVTWANAPAADAQFAVFTPDSDVGQKISLTDRTALDPATDIPGNTQWNTVLNPIPADSEILARIATGLPPVDFQMAIGASSRPIHSYELRASDATWDYYGSGGVGSAGVAGAIQKRVERFHTAWHGDLAGRALVPIQAVREIADANTAARWPGEVFVIPHEIPADQGPFTLRAFLHVAEGSYPTGAKMRINASGRNGAYVTLSSDSPAELAFDAIQVRNLTQNARDGLVGGLPRLQIAANDNTELAVIPLRIPAIPRGKWRQLAGASPYTVLLTDDEFMIEATHTTGGVARTLRRIIPRLVMTQAAKVEIIAEAAPQTGNLNNWAGVSYLINAAGTELTVANVGNNDSVAGSYPITAVYAR